MSKIYILLLILLSGIIFYSCEKEDDKTTFDNPHKEKLITSLNQELHALPNDPLDWKEKDLKFLDSQADKSIIGLGEANHGSADFFNAKAQIFKYLVKNHGYKVFAIEADFGESLILNRIIQSGADSYITTAMNKYMFFWTWKTQEVRNLLKWMCQYNKGKSEEEKVHYVGIDCQLNELNTDELNHYLQNANISFASFADSLMDEAKKATGNNFSSYNDTSFKKYLEKLSALNDSMENSKTKLIQNSSEKEYKLYKRTLEIIEQTSKYRVQENDYDFRDSCMAENATWLIDQYNDKIALWAHNGHISKMSTYYGFSGYTMGKHIDNKIGDEYGTIGFAFSKGSFNAVDNESKKLITHTINSDPIENTLTDYFSMAKAKTFTISISELTNHNSWETEFLNPTKYLAIGAKYNSNPKNFYRPIEKYHFDRLIYFDKISESNFLWNTKKGEISSSQPNAKNF